MWPCDGLGQPDSVCGISGAPVGSREMDGTPGSIPPIPAGAYSCALDIEPSRFEFRSRKSACIIVGHMVLPGAFKPPVSDRSWARKRRAVTMTGPWAKSVRLQLPLPAIAVPIRF